jgi:hypothetical protein
MSGLPVSLKLISHAGKIDGFLYLSEMTQSYRNDSEVTLETVYSFPVSEEAGMCGFRANVNGKPLEGELLAREAAEERYEDALADGDSPVMLYESSPGILTLSIGNLAPSDVCEASLSLVELLRFEGSLARITVPTVLAPRSGDMYLTGELKPHESIESSTRAEYGLSVDVRIPFHGPGSRVCCPSHVTSCGLETDGVVVSTAGEPLPDRDFVLLLENVAPPAQAGAYAFRDEQEGLWGVLALYHPDIPEGSATGTLNVLMDASFTMEEAGFDQGMRLASCVIAGLGTRGSGSAAYVFSDLGLRQIQPDSGSAGWSSGALLSKLYHIDNIDTSSGKRLADALKAFAVPDPPFPGDAPPALLLVTDCLEAGTSDILDAARELYPRLFAVGVGHSPLSGHLRRLAEAAPGGGYAVAPAPAEGPYEPGEALARAIRAAALNASGQDWGGRAPLWTSPPPRILSPGVTFPAWALMDGPPAGSPSMAWSLGGREGGSMTAKLLPGQHSRELAVLLSIERIRRSEADTQTRNALGIGWDDELPDGVISGRERPTGHRPSRKPGTGDRPCGDTATGDRPCGDSGTGDRPCANSGSGDRPCADSATEDRPGGDSRTGGRPGGDSRTGGRPGGDSATGGRPAWDSWTGTVTSRTQTLDSQERLALALRQGVLAAGTAWCLVYRRYPDQKARGIPELQQIPQTSPETRPPCVNLERPDYRGITGCADDEYFPRRRKELSDGEAYFMPAPWDLEIRHSLERPDPAVPYDPRSRRLP